MADPLLPRYRQALRQLLSGSAEPARTQAYMLGREALADGRGLPGVLEVHHLALGEALCEGALPSGQLVRAADDLLAEATAPFEMAYRGCRDANETLRSLNLDLSATVEEGARAAAGSLDRLRQVDAERRRLLAHLVNAQEAERRRIAAEIHDDAVQVVTALGLRLGLLALRVADPELQAMVAAAEEAASEAAASLRGMMFDLRPPSLQHGDLVPALEELRMRFRQDWDFDWTIDSELVEEPPAELRVALFRVAQEALTNARKHARATRVRVRLENREGGVLLEVHDDGTGFDPDREDSRIGHLGLVSMRERVELAAGWWRIDSAPGEGTTVRAWVPLAGQQQLEEAHAR